MNSKTNVSFSASEVSACADALATTNKTYGFIRQYSLSRFIKELAPYPRTAYHEKMYQDAINNMTLNVLARWELRKRAKLAKCEANAYANDEEISAKDLAIDKLIPTKLQLEIDSELAQSQAKQKAKRKSYGVKLSARFLAYAKITKEASIRKTNRHGAFA